MLAVDMTRFSRVNECMGAMAGDELLITFARRLVSALRPSDVLARTSGDEFGILMRLDRGPGDALRAAERIKAVLTLPFRLSELEIRVDCAIGCAILNQGVASADEVFRNAQFALKNAKQTRHHPDLRAGPGRGGPPPLQHGDRIARARSRPTASTLAYQPLIELKTGRVAGFEALARWTDDEGRVIPPDEFIPVAEESGLIVQLGRWALETATRTLADWDRAAGMRAADRRQRQHVADPDQPRRRRRRRLRRAGRERHFRRAAHRRAHRKRDHPGSGARRQGAERAEAARRARRDGRFRHRLHLARLDAAAADRRAQDRPALRRRR